MKKIFMCIVVILCGLSCDDANNNLFEDITDKGGFALFKESINLVHDIAGADETVINTEIIDPNNNATSYALTIQTDAGLTDPIAILTSFPGRLVVTRQMVIDALGLADASELPPTVKFIGIVTSPNGTFSGEAIDFDVTMNTQNGGNTQVDAFVIPKQALRFSIVMFQQFPENTLVVTPIRNGDDDAEEVAFNPDPVPPGDPVGEMDLGSSDLELGEKSSDDGIQHIGLRFTLIGIPSGATITAANIQFTADNTGSDPVQYTIYGENTGNSETFTSSNSNITNRPLTSTSVVWNIPPWVSSGDKGPAQQSVDISSVVQEIIDRDDWVPANSISIIMLASGPSLLSTSSSGGREAETFPEDEPELLLTYTN